MTISSADNQLTPAQRRSVSLVFKRLAHSMRRWPVLSIASILVAMAAVVIAPIVGLGRSMISMDLIFILPFLIGVAFCFAVVTCFARGLVSGAALLLVSPIIYLSALASVIFMAMQVAL